MRRWFHAFTLPLVVGGACQQPRAPAIPPAPPKSTEPTAPAPDAEPPPAPTNPLRTVYGPALRGDLKQAMAELAHVDRAQLDEKDRAAHECFVARFERRELPPVEGDDPWIRDLVNLYRAYWTSVMVGERTHEQGEADLLAALTTFLRKHGHRKRIADLDAATAALGQQLDNRGYHSIRGVTQPFWELMAWKTETEERYEVELPQTKVTVEVVFMDGFVTLGWTGYATCGKYFSGGWATKQALHCVRSAYDLESEAFEVSYLAHEGQHFADYKAFPKLEQPELEYRGKLTELAKAKTSAHGLLARFAATTGTERSTPHNLANGWVTQDMAAKLLGGVDADPSGFADASVERINEAAVALLAESTMKLEALGASAVERFADR